MLHNREIESVANSNNEQQQAIINNAKQLLEQAVIYEEQLLIESKRKRSKANQHGMPMLSALSDLTAQFDILVDKFNDKKNEPSLKEALFEIIDATEKMLIANQSPGARYFFAKAPLIGSPFTNGEQKQTIIDLTNYLKIANEVVNDPADTTKFNKLLNAADHAHTMGRNYKIMGAALIGLGGLLIGTLIALICFVAPPALLVFIFMVTGAACVAIWSGLNTGKIGANIDKSAKNMASKLTGLTDQIVETKKGALQSTQSFWAKCLSSVSGTSKDPSKDLTLQLGR